MTTQEFFEQLDGRIAKYDLLCHPFYKAWAAGELARGDLRDYGRAYHQHVAAFPSYLDEFAKRVSDPSLRRAVLANRDEEIGARGARSHAELWLDFVEGIAEGSDDQSGQEGPSHAAPELRELTDWFHSIAGDGAPEEALAAFYAYESQVPRVAAEKARGLREMYAADEKTCAYFTLHTTADVYHSRVWRNQLGKFVCDNPEAADRALAAGETAAKKLWQALDEIEAGRLARAA
jgi:pyrroloquinoline-quinone synthase